MHASASNKPAFYNMHSTSPSLIPNKTLRLCFELANGKLVARPFTFLTPTALELTDFPARAVWLTHIIDRLSIAFSGHP